MKIGEVIEQEELKKKEEQEEILEGVGENKDGEVEEKYILASSVFW